MRIITLNTLDDSKYKPLGLVRGTIVHSVSFFRDILGNLTGLLGGKNAAINKKIDDVYKEAISELEAYTKSTYPSATSIAGVEISLTEMREFIICVATGTALVETTTKNGPTNANPVSPAQVPVRAMTGGKKRKTKRMVRKSHKSRKCRK
jgi:uncharacterized protein YbjQ (UPF0145 family)